LVERADSYRRAGPVIDTDGLDPERVADAVERAVA
jgi:hypothetical protein